MNNNNDQHETEDEKSMNRRRIRRGANRGHGSMPEPEDVMPSVTASAPTFRAMAIQNRGPQLMMPPAFVATKQSPFQTPKTNEELLLKSKPKQQPALQQQPAPQQEFVLNTESRPCFGWDFAKIQIQDLPMYFPRDMIQWEFPSEQLPVVLQRLSKRLRASSIQASLSHEPLSAKLQTCHECAELYLVFFNEPNGTVSMSVQRHKGCQMVSNKCIRHLVDAAKGILPEEEDESNPSKESAPADTAIAVKAMERLMERCASESTYSTAVPSEAQNVHPSDNSHPFLKQTPEQMIESAVRDLHGWLEQPRRLDLRKHALEYLLAMTDLKRTLSSTAIATSLMILRGDLPCYVTSDLSSQAQTIQSVILNVLLTRELPGDRAVFWEGTTKKSRSKRNAQVDMDVEMSAYFPEADKDVTAASAGYPPFYTDFMNELFNLALQILVQSLDVLACFPEANSNMGGNVANQLFTRASEVADGKNLYQTLLSCVGHAESKLANGYLACKALRLLASGHPGIKDQIKFDDNAKQSIDNAYQVGQMRHTLLKIESYQLWQTVCQ